jgi:hypothetical protein
MIRIEWEGYKIFDAGRWAQSSNLPLNKFEFLGYKLIISHRKKNKQTGHDFLISATNNYQALSYDIVCHHKMKATWFACANASLISFLDPCLFLYFLKKLNLFYFKLIFFMFSNYFDVLISKINFFKKNHFNTFLNKKYFKN